MKWRRARHIDAVLADRPVPDVPLDDADPEDVDALALAIELRAARPGAGYPDEAFVAGLRQRLAEAAAPGPPSAMVSRRTALVGAAGAVAGAAAASVVAVGLEARRSTAPDGGSAIALPHGQWVAIARSGDLADATIWPFRTAAMTGFVSLRPDGTPVAVSGACTHQGCLLRPNAAEGRLECPCHATAFAPDGRCSTTSFPPRRPGWPTSRSARPTAPSKHCSRPPRASHGLAPRVLTVCGRPWRR